MYSEAYFRCVCIFHFPADSSLTFSPDFNFLSAFVLPTLSQALACLDDSDTSIIQVDTDLQSFSYCHAGPFCEASSPCTTGGLGKTFVFRMVNGHADEYIILKSRLRDELQIQIIM